MKLQFWQRLGHIQPGENGSGKSIILDAIMALVGGKVDGSMVRKGAERGCLLEAFFPIPETYFDEITSISQTRGGCMKNETLPDPGTRVRAEGRNVARVNGRCVNCGAVEGTNGHVSGGYSRTVGTTFRCWTVRSHLGRSIDMRAVRRNMRIPHRVS